MRAETRDETRDRLIGFKSRDHRSLNGARRLLRTQRVAGGGLFLRGVSSEMIRGVEPESRALDHLYIRCRGALPIRSSSRATRARVGSWLAPAPQSNESQCEVAGATKPSSSQALVACRSARDSGWRNTARRISGPPMATGSSQYSECGMFLQTGRFRPLST